MQCNAAVGVKAFFDMMHSGPHKLMLFGAACTHVTDPIAKASKHWHLTQVLYICNYLLQTIIYAILFFVFVLNLFKKNAHRAIIKIPLILASNETNASSKFTIVPYLRLNSFKRIV